MRINTVTATAFGPLVDETLNFAPGMTVIVGDNESAKSTWHAAVYAALCGRRRGKGAPPKDERRFADLHRPWDEDRWVVSANLSLDDGRTVEMYQDLDGKVDCRAHDMGLGAADISNEIMFEGSPDASRWLGLDRRSFASTACVNQAELLEVLADADGLQEHLQRAAATAGTTDATAAAALVRLAAFSRDFVGTNQSNSTKPLRQAKNTVERTNAALTGARAAHAQYLDLVTEADAARQAAHAATAAVTALASQLSAAEAALEAARGCVTATGDVDRLTERAAILADDLATATDNLQAARVLDARFGGHAPAGTLADEDTTQLVASALSNYRALSPVAELSGATSAQLAASLAALPAMPEGDTAMAQEVRTAGSAFERAAALLRAHDDDRPTPLPELSPELAAATAAGPDLLRELAAALNTPAPAPNPALAGAVSAAQDELSAANAALAGAPELTAASLAGGKRTSSGRRLGTLMAAAGAGLTVLALVGLLAGAPGPQALVATLGLLVLAAGVLVRSKAAKAGLVPGPGGLEPGAITAARQRLLDAHTALASAAGRLDAHQGQVDQAAAAAAVVTARVEQLALAADPAELKALATAVEHRAVAAEAVRVWTARRGTFEAAYDDALGALGAALDAHHGDPDPDPSARYRRYEQSCEQRAQVAAEAGRRDQFVRDHDTRVRAEQAAEAGLARAAAALTGLRAGAAAITVPDAATEQADALADALSHWQTQRSTDVAGAEDAQADWAQLGALLGERTLSDLEASTVDLTARLASARAELASAQLAQTGAAQACAQALGALPAELVGSAGPADADVERAAGTAVAATRGALAAARQGATSAGHDAADADGALRERARVLPSVAEAEEHLQDAQGELARVLELEATLVATRNFLDAAQQRVHRDIAPVLATTLTAWLPAITAGRYVKAAVDPRTLQVQVCGPSGNYRSADRLSHGTAEQVYLLLRVALARHLVTEGATCPLLLDDVTVQADGKRTIAILELLHELSKDQQVIVFSQQQHVADWANQSLTGPEDEVREITTVPWS